VRLPGALRYGGFWIRALALFIDSLVLSIARVVVNLSFSQNRLLQMDQSPAGLLQILQAQGIALTINLLIGAAYEIWMVGRFGATVGKMVCHLRVETADGGKVSYFRSLGRYFAKFLSAFTLGIGYIMAGIDDEKRALHDRICNTRVIKK
jgi:uncharacterized RDD family membrane protein YckC